MSSLTLPMEAKLRKSIFTRSGIDIASVRSDELNVPMTSSGEFTSAITDRSEPAPGMFCTTIPGEPDRKAPEMPLNQARIAIHPAAGRHADDDLDGLAAERGGFGLGGHRRRRRERKQWQIQQAAWRSKRR